MDAIRSIVASLSPAPRVIEGKCVANLLPHGAPDKFHAVRTLARLAHCDTVIFAGDDVTDDVVFEQAPPNWLTIRIEALDHHRARFHLNHQNEVAIFLQRLLRSVEQRRQGDRPIDVIWVVALLLLLDNLGVDITTLVACLGIGGIAVALALQNIPGDLFASLSIAEELVFSNNDLLKSRVRNYKRMAERRVVFGFGVTYDTPPETLESLVATVRRIIEAKDGTRFDRAHFKSFGASSLDFEAVYHILSPDYGAFMDAQPRINLAFPTQTIHVATLPR